MTLLNAGSFRAQMKIQQMAFLLVGITIFFALVGVIYFSITISHARTSAQSAQNEEAILLARKLAGSPEFAFTSSSDCATCIDIDKIIQISDLSGYEELWNMDHVFVTRISPQYSNEKCTRANYPNCDKIILANRSTNLATKTAFVTLAGWDGIINSYRYELGRIEVSSKQI